MKFSKLYWFIGRRSVLSSYNKLLIYKQVLKPVWTYGMPLWGCASASNLKTIQKFQNKVLRTIVNALWYVRTADLHRDLGIDEVSKEILKFAAAHDIILRRHVNPQASSLAYNVEPERRLKPSDFIFQHQR